MVELNNGLRLARTAVYGVSTLFSLVVIITAAIVTHYTTTRSYYGFYYTYAALGIATAILTMFTLPVMWFLSEKRKGSIAAMVVVDISWGWFLWIMWLSTAASSAGWLGSCSWYGYGGSDWETACHSTKALSAFAFLTWLALMFFNFTLFAFTIRQHMRGNTGIWRAQITEADFTAVGNNTVFAPGAEMKGQPGFAPQYPPQGTPTTGYSPQQYPQQPQGYAPAPGTPQTNPYPQV
ncbi:hypothetical protein CVT24_010494 [Panaeolus cyanescens]|uniref:MARVEL domain-containing protein n=1 Tax=Panaeolus cyanescens TaxID=181874 RepID=A0A409YLR1_9AGAR|nr:hypothetical protein CVT24_010494 [Panaeolus cyanescens]